MEPLVTGDGTSASSEVCVRLDFVCTACHATTPAAVYGVGFAVGGHQPGEVATRAAADDAEELVRLAPCPKCGRRDRREVAWLVGAAVLQVLMGLAFGGIAIALGVASYLSDRGGVAVPMWIPALLGALAIALLARGIGSALTRWNASANRVRLIPSDE